MIGSLPFVRPTNPPTALECATRPTSCAASLELARQAAATERAREVRRRFLGEGTPYTPQPVRFYGH